MAGLRNSAKSGEMAAVMEWIESGMHPDGDASETGSVCMSMHVSMHLCTDCCSVRHR